MSVHCWKITLPLQVSDQSLTCCWKQTNVHNSCSTFTFQFIWNLDSRHSLECSECSVCVETQVKLLQLRNFSRRKLAELPAKFQLVVPIGVPPPTFHTVILGCTLLRQIKSFFLFSHLLKIKSLNSNRVLPFDIFFSNTAQP
jgi:hypothetical protein